MSTHKRLDKKTIFILLLSIVGAIYVFTTILFKKNQNNSPQRPPRIPTIIQETIAGEGNCLEIKPPLKRFDPNIKMLKYNPFTNKTLQALHYETSDERKVRFSSVYNEGMWNNKLKHVPQSGIGSARSYTNSARHAIKTVVKAYGIKTFVDAHCGDVNWIQLLFPFFKENQIEYIGVDIVPELIAKHKVTFKDYEGTVKFQEKDLAEQILPKCDLIFCRQALQHMNPGNVLKTIHNFCKSGAKYLMTTLYLTGTQEENEKLIFGPHASLINFLAPPYSFIEPIAMFVDGQLNQKQYLALWELPLEGCLDYNFNPNNHLNN